MQMSKKKRLRSDDKGRAKANIEQALKDAKLTDSQIAELVKILKSYKTGG